MQLSDNNVWTRTNKFNKSLDLTKGADVDSANDCVLLTDVNYNDITGAVQINGYTDGVLNEVRKFHFDGAPLLKHNTAPSVGVSELFLPNAIDLQVSADAELEFTYDGAIWRLTGGANLITGKIISTGITVDTTLRTTASSSYTDTGVQIIRTLANSANKFRIRVHGIHGHSIASVALLTVFRDAVDLTPGGVDCMAGVEFNNVDTTQKESFSFELEDSPGDVLAHTYKLRWKTSSGTAYLGNDASSSSGQSPTTITIDEITP